MGPATRRDQTARRNCARREQEAEAVMTDESADLLLDRVADGHDAAPRSIALTSSKTAATAVALVATLGPAAAGWVVSVRQMNGMDTGVATGLGSLAFFIVLWVWMMAAMMLPGAVPVIMRRARAPRGVLVVPLSVGSSPGLWPVLALPVHALSRH